MKKLTTAKASNDALTGRIDFSEAIEVFGELAKKKDINPYEKPAFYYARLAGHYEGTLRCMLMYKDAKVIHQKIRKALKEAEKIK